MPMTTTAEHIAARGDADLRERLVAMAEQLGLPDAATFVSQNLGRLISVPILDGASETNITRVHAYANGERKKHLAAAEVAYAEAKAADKALPPGKNPGAVTDIHLSAAIAAVNTTEGVLP